MKIIKAHNIKNVISTLDKEYKQFYGKMNTGQTVYEQLQEILNECIEKGWSYRFITKRDEYNDRRCSTLYVSNGEMYEDHSYVSYHDLFSKDSGLMEFVEWKPLTLQELSYHQMRSDSLDYRYMKMSLFTAEEKCNYFVNNAIVPTKQLSICIECSEEVPEREPVSNCHGYCRLEI